MTERCCKIADCDTRKKRLKKGEKLRLIKGFCEKHYKRFHRGQIDEEGNELRELAHTGKKRYKKCKIHGCKREPGKSKYFIKGFCPLHYSRYKCGIIDLDGNILRKFKKGLYKKCKIRNCNGSPDEKGHFRKGFCYRHYMQFYNKNINLQGKKINPNFKPRKDV